jgi:putative endonuclease
MFYVYAIKSSSRKYVYIGHSSNIENRVRQHNHGQTKANKLARPFKLFYYEEVESRQEAVVREKQLKSGFNREALKNIAYNYGELPLPAGRQARG